MAPTAYIKKLADAGKGTVPSLEKKWKKAKKKGKQAGKGYGYITAIFKNMAHANEEHSKLYHTLALANLLTENLRSESLHNMIQPYHIMQLLIDFCKTFKEWDAYELGLIDSEGKILKKPKTDKEKAALPPLMVMLLKLKRGLIPVERMSIWNNYFVSWSQVYMAEIKEQLDLMLKEDGAAMTTGNVAGAATPLGAVYRRKSPFNSKKKKSSKKRKK